MAQDPEREEERPEEQSGDDVPLTTHALDMVTIWTSEAGTVTAEIESDMIRGVLESNDIPVMVVGASQYPNLGFEQMPFQIFETKARSILSPVSGFLAEAGFTHSLTPARNCTFGCSYCYVPTLRVQGGLRPDDWKHWGEWTTFKSNAVALARRELRPHHVIYCSPLTDPYQPVEADQRLLPGRQI